jgi:hypothetical protein
LTTGTLDRPKWDTRPSLGKPKWDTRPAKVGHSTGQSGTLDRRLAAGMPVPAAVSGRLHKVFKREKKIARARVAAKGIDSLRYDCSRADGEELKASDSKQSCAVYPNQSNYGVNPGLPPPAYAAPPTH